MPKNREFLVGAIVTVIATVLTLLLGEGLLRLIASRKLMYNIEMVRYARQLKERDPQGVVSHVHRPSRRAKLMGVEIALNSLGDRGPELRDPKPAGTRRALVLGSSITMGWGVPFDSIFTSVAGQQLGPAWEFVNAGIGNYNTAFQQELFRRQYPQVQPDHVILSYFISDVQPRTMGRDNLLLKHSFLAAWAFDRVSHWQFSKKGKDLFTHYSELYTDQSEPWMTTQKIIREMHDACAAKNVGFTVMIIPDIHDLSPNTPYRALYEKMEASFRAAGFDVLNTFAALQERFGTDVTKLWIQADDPHPNAAGHALMGELLADHLRGRYPAPPPR